MTKPYYATVQQMQSATDFKTTAYEQGRLSRLLDAASREVERITHRHFYPLTETVEWVDPPNYTLRRTSSSGFFIERDLIAITAATVDSVAQTVADIELYPKHFGPPYSWVGLTGEDISITGRWGFSEDTTPAGALESAIGDTTGTTVEVTDSSLIGVGDLIKVDDEQMIVTDVDQFDTTVNLSANLTADKSDVTVTVSAATINVGEVILINSERMKVIDVSGSDLTVKRAWDGSVLAAHTSADDIYAPRSLTVERGAVGTTAATHSDAASITKNVPPAMIVDLCLAIAIATFEQETAGYGRTVGAGDSEREARGAGVHDLRDRVRRSYRRYRAAVI